MITVLHRGGYAQMITILHGGGSLGTPKSDYVICARPLTPIPIQFMGVNAMWAVVHWIIWDGKVSNSQDIVASVLSPGEY